MPNQIAFYPQSSSGGAVQLIQTQTVASPVAAITFSSIPQTFKNIKIVGSFLLTGGTNLTVKANGDSTAAHYAYGLVYQAGGTVGNTNSNSASQALIGGSSGVVSLDIAAYSATLPNWTGTFSTMVIGGTPLNGSVGGSYVNGITSLTFADAGGSVTFAVGSTFSLYGF